MTTLIVAENPSQWPLDIPGTEVVAARAYLTDKRFAELKRVKVFNFCRGYGYQSVGNYVSLLATARGHRPLPSVKTLQDLRRSAVLRIVSDDFAQIVQKALGPLRSDRFELSVYFGRNTAERYDRIAQTLYTHFPVPFLRAEFVRVDQWRLQSVRIIASRDIPESHHDFVVQQAQRFLTRTPSVRRFRPRFDLAMLVNAEEVDAPSDERALQAFIREGRKLGIDVTRIGKNDAGRLAEFDGLFIRETTAVNHHTYRMASRAEAEGLVVIDDPESIVRCCNKVYQSELFLRHRIPTPRSLIVHRDNAEAVGQSLGFPCVLKQPDGSFSSGVVKASDQSELTEHLNRLFTRSELVVAQEYVPSDFDWRIGVLAGQPLYAARYYMARGHWQIQKSTGERRRSYGRVETVPVEEAPREAVALAVRACRLIGNGIYGVDLKPQGKRFVVIEVNDNPNIDAGLEDRLLKGELYASVMRTFLSRMERQRSRAGQ